MLRCLALLMLPVAAWSCSCGPPGPPCQAASQSNAIFLGTVINLTHEQPKPDSDGNLQINGFLGTHVFFQVSEAFRGMEGRSRQVEIRTGMGGGDCGYDFRRKLCCLRVPEPGWPAGGRHLFAHAPCI
jgi:hypothetical protein